MLCSIPALSPIPALSLCVNKAEACSVSVTALSNSDGHYPISHYRAMSVTLSDSDRCRKQPAGSSRATLAPTESRIAAERSDSDLAITQQTSALGPAPLAHSGAPRPRPPITPGPPCAWSRARGLGPAHARHQLPAPARRGPALLHPAARPMGPGPHGRGSESPADATPRSRWLSRRGRTGKGP
jgi:hypothetical protein